MVALVGVQSESEPHACGFSESPGQIDPPNCGTRLAAGGVESMDRHEFGDRLFVAAGRQQCFAEGVMKTPGGISGRDGLAEHGDSAIGVALFDKSARSTRG